MDAAGPIAHVDPFSLKQPGELFTLDEEQTFATAQYLDRRKLSIYGGSAEVQRNIISRRIINL